MSPVTTKAVRPKHQSKIKLTTFSRNVIERAKTYDVKYMPGFGYGNCLYGKDPYGTPWHSFNFSTTRFFSGRLPTFSSPYAIKWMVTSSITNREPEINPHSQSVIESLEYILDYIRHQSQKFLLIFNRFLTDVQKPEYHPSIIQAFHSTSTLERGTFISKEISIHLHKVLVQPHPTTSIQRYLGSLVVQDVSNLTRTTILGRVIEHTLQRIAGLERARSVKYLINTFTNLFSTYRTPQHHYTLNGTLAIQHTTGIPAIITQTYKSINRVFHQITTARRTNHQAIQSWLNLYKSVTRIPPQTLYLYIGSITSPIDVFRAFFGQVPHWTPLSQLYLQNFQYQKTLTRPAVFLSAFLTFVHIHPSQQVIPHQSILNGQHHYNFHSTASKIQDGHLDYQPIEVPYSVFSINGSVAVLKPVTAAIYVSNQGYGTEPYGEDFYGGVRRILELIYYGKNYILNISTQIPNPQSSKTILVGIGKRTTLGYTPASTTVQPIIVVSPVFNYPQPQIRPNITESFRLTADVPRTTSAYTKSTTIIQKVTQRPTPISTKSCLITIALTTTVREIQTVTRSIHFCDSGYGARPYGETEYGGVLSTINY